jgi:molybdopterin synthase catalytic subunit
MKLTVRLFAALRERAGKSELALEDLPDGLDVGALKREIERRHPALGSLAQVRGAVGTEYVAETRRLADGETVALIPPVSGGAGNVEHGAFELRAGALDAAECLELVRDAHFGGIATFIGTTRAMSRGREVLRLEYEAFDAMTRAEMARIFERCRAHVATSPERTLRMLVHHRIGTVEVGEASVVIAVASPHRDAAFAACRFLIDELKKSMPIWKKEIYADGGEWIGERS